MRALQGFIYLTMPKLRTLLCFLLSALFAGLLTAPAHAQNPVTWTAQLQPQEIRAGEGGRIVLSAKVEPKWYFYAPSTPPGGPIPTKITLTEGPLELKGPIAQSKPNRHMDEGFGIEVETYEKAAAFGLPIVVKADASGAQKVVVKARYQACDKVKGICLPPKTVEVPVEFTVAAGAARPDKTTPDTSVPALSATQGNDDGAAGTPTEAQPETAPATETAPGDIAATTAPAATALAATTAPVVPGADLGLFQFVALAFGAGFLAILTPCVFPMIPITVALFSKQSEGNRLVGPLVYCFGIIATFTLIGVAVSALVGAEGLSRFAANPFVNIALATLFLVLALNLFGVFEIVVPSSLLNRVQPKGKTGIVAPLLMGFAFTLTSFTCTVPFVGTALVTAATKGAFYPALGMLAFSTAFALPFFLLALFPGFLAKLPRSGQWLVSVKAFMGFLEVAAALKFLQVADYSLGLGLITRPVFLAVWFAIAVIAGFYLLRWVRLPNDSPAQQLGPGRRILGVATLGVATWLLAANNGASLHDLDAYLPPRDYGSKEKVASPWIVNDLDKAKARAKAENKPLLINFTGYACTNCRLMENNVLPHPEVVEKLDGFVPVELFTDGTDAKSREFNQYQQEKFGTVAIPYYAVVTPDGQITGRLEGLERNPTKFANFLQTSRLQARVATRAE